MYSGRHGLSLSPGEMAYGKTYEKMGVDEIQLDGGKLEGKPVEPSGAISFTKEHQSIRLTRIILY